ncbi:MAG TPA: carboxypeptidase-like regulatory domain-containing protein, partial [Bryobacteraceae bacterium]|nr:carboxypeptidase-like regulatory domain-containing protein [Bryobacteraceae bacterium]
MALLFGIVASLAFGQVGNGTITGTVSDPAGAVVPGARVEATNAQTGVVFPAVSTNTGNYTIPDLAVGTYSVSAKVTGFKAYQHPGLAVGAAQTIREDITLQVGNATTETVTVTAEASLLKTESGDVSHNVSIDQLDDLPLLGIGTANSGS